MSRQPILASPVFKLTHYHGPGVRRETNGPVATIILDRPERRNAVDPPTAEALRVAFRAFDQDQTARVAVLWGAGGTFCAGYDLKAFAAAPRRLARAYGEGPMGPTGIRPPTRSGCGSAPRCATSTRSGCGRRPPARASKAPVASRRAPAATAASRSAERRPRRLCDARREASLKS